MWTGVESEIFWLLEVAPPAPPPQTLHLAMPNPKSYMAQGNCTNGYLHIVCLNINSYKSSNG